MTIIKDLYIYPLKSARGIALGRAHAEGRGLRYDRRWMAVDSTGRFISQRTHPLMALIDVAIDGMHLSLSANGHGGTTLPLFPLRTPPPRSQSSRMRRTVVVWDDTVEAEATPPEADEWISDLLGERCAIVYFPDDARRPVDPRYARQHEHTAFSDGYPVLLLSQASLDELNTHIDSPVTMDRFRPNIVVDGCMPFWEDAQQTLAVGDAELAVVKPCARCMIPTIDQQTARAGVEPLAALSTYRKTNGKVLFGQNALVLSPGAIAIGDPVTAVTAHAYASDRI